jgi:hypothetical protein
MYEYLHLYSVVSCKMNDIRYTATVVSLPTLHVPTSYGDLDSTVYDILFVLLITQLRRDEEPSTSKVVLVL